MSGKVGCWLLGPLLRAEFRLADRQAKRQPGDLYWTGRRTGALRIYQALNTREGHLGEGVDL
jgi:hypothetical protein